MMRPKSCLVKKSLLTQITVRIGFPIFGLQLDANIHRPNSDANLTTTTDNIAGLGFGSLKTMLAKEVFDGGFHITRCEDASTKKALKHTVV